MALTPEDGTGLAAADCYATEAEVGSYYSSIAQTPAAWTAAGTSDREAAIRRATMALDGFYRGLFIGTRSFAVQALEWPRTNAKTSDGFTIAASGSGSIPTELKRATAELVERALAGDLVADFDDERLVESESLDVGPISLQQTYAAGGARISHTRYPLVDNLLARILRTQRPSGIAIVEMQRA